jgi:PAS domain S-box-containing protein
MKVSDMARDPLERRVDELTALYRLTDRLYRAASLDDVYDAALDCLAETLDCERASVLLFDEAGVMRFVAWRGLSAGYRKAVDGHTPWKPGERDPQPVFVSDIADTSESDRIKQVIAAEGITALGFIPLVSRGGCIGKFMTYYPEARQFQPKETDLAIAISRQVGFSLERFRAEAAREAAVEELKESETRFRLISEAAPVMLWLSDSSGRCLHLNAALRKFWGVAEDDVAAFDWRFSMHPDDADRIGVAMWNATVAQQPVSLSGRYRNAEGEYRVLETNARPRFSASGEFLGLIGVNIDVSDKARHEQQRELLLAELNHRVKNSLAVVQGIAFQTFRGDNARPEARAAFEGRLAALAAAHNLLTQAHWESASLDEIAADALQTRGVNAQRIALSGPRLLLPPKSALALALALHELATNALKYGALSRDGGKVELAWRCDEASPGAPGRLHLSWRESGGPAVQAPTRRGFGSMLVERTLAQDLNGEVAMEFRPEGVVCSIDAPLDWGAKGP